jgi:acetolactate synthase I/III small subunit
VKHTLVALMQDHPGVLNRVVSLVRRRNFNIDSLTVGHSETPGISRMTLVVDAADVEQIIKQLYRLIEVLKVSDVTLDPVVEREIALIKLHVNRPSRSELVALSTVYHAKIVDVGPTTMIVEMTGPPDDVDRFVELVRPFGIKEMMRTGRIAMVRGPLTHRAPGEAEPVESPRAVEAELATAV